MITNVVNEFEVELFVVRKTKVNGNDDDEHSLTVNIGVTVSLHSTPWVYIGVTVSLHDTWGVHLGVSCNDTVTPIFTVRNVFVIIIFIHFYFSNNKQLYFKQ